MQERRKTHRDRTYLGARIAFNANNSTMDCLVKDMTRDGARICFESAPAIPDAFDIYLRQSSEPRPARVVWRQANTAGVVFLPTASTLSPEAARRIREAERERQAMARLARERA